MQHTRALFIPLLALAGVAALAAPSARAATPETELAAVLNPDAAVHPFVANYGQDDPAVLFAARSFGGTVAIREGDIALSLAAHPFAPRSSTTIRFSGAELLDAFEGEPAAATANFYLGAEPGAWLEELPTHADVDLYEVAPGVDVQVDASGRDMRWLATTPDPELLGGLRWRYGNASSVELDGEGKLLVTLPAYDEAGYELPGLTRTFSVAPPRAWQGFEGELNPIEAQFLVEGGEVSVTLVGAEPGLPTQVELMTRYAPRHGGADSQRTSTGTGAVGTSDAALVGTGDFDTDMLSLRLDDSGRQITGLTVVGGAGSSTGGGLGHSQSGRVWLTGSTDADDFPTFAAVQPARAGGKDATLVELDAEGYLLSSSYFGGSGDDAGADLEVDPQGRLWLTGTASEPIEGPALTLPYGTAFAAAGEHSELFLTAIDSGGLTVEGTGCFGGTTPGGTPPSVTVDAQGSVWVGVRGTINQSPRTVVTYSESAPHSGGPSCTRNGDGWGAEALCWKHHATGVPYTPANLTPAPVFCGLGPALSSGCHSDLNDEEANPQVFPSDPAGVWEGPNQLGLNEINIALTGAEVMIATALYMHRWGSPVYANGYTPSSPTDEQAIGFHQVSFDAASDPAANCDWLGFQDTSVPGWDSHPIYQVAANCDAHRQLSIVDTNISFWDWSGSQTVGYTTGQWIGPDTPWWVPAPISNPPFYAFDKSQVYIGDPPADEAFMAAHVSEYANLAAAGVVEDMQIARTWYESGEAVAEQLDTEAVYPR